MEDIPLLQAGLHQFKLSDIGNHFLQGFPNSKTRKDLIDGLNSFASLLTQVKTPIELWIDGSFTTKKNDPSDIDMVLFASADLVNLLPLGNQKLLQTLTDRDSMKAQFGCDVLFCPSEDENMRSYWRGWYGFDRNETPKGIAVVTV